MFCMLKVYIYIYPAYVSKHNSNHEKQVVILMISNRKVHSRLETLAMRATSEGKRCHYLTVKKLSALLKGMTSKRHRDFCLNCLHSFATEKKT